VYLENISKIFIIFLIYFNYIFLFLDLLNVQILQNSYSALLGSNSVTIDCTVTGNPAATSVSWTKTQGSQTTNLNIANNSGKYQGATVNTPSLTILNIAQSDEANYVCSATNIVGTASSQTAFLDVTGSKFLTVLSVDHVLNVILFSFCPTLN
jgi:hypothetical protein